MGQQRSDRLFHILLRLFPSSFRGDHGHDMQSMLRSELREIRAERARLGILRFWWRAVTGVLRTAPREHLDDLMLDLRYAVRLMRKRPLFTLTAALSLAIGIGATTTVTAIFNAIFLRPIPGIERPDELINVQAKTRVQEGFELVSYPNYTDLRDGSTPVADLAGFHGISFSLGLAPGSEPELVPGQFLTGNYFDLLGVRPRLGRFFLAEEDGAPGAHPIAVITSRLWQDRFGGDESILGREIWLNRTPFTIIGVAPEGFRGHFIGFNIDLFVPSAMAGIADLPERSDRQAHWLELIGRLRDGVTLEQARASFDTSGRQLAAAWPDANRGLEIHVAPATGIDADFRGGLLVFLIILLSVSGFVLIIACMNVANMMLTRVAWRRQEMVLRLALGAPRLRLARQLLTESLLLALLAGGLGIMLALWATSVARAAFPAVDPRISVAIQLDPLSLGVALAISLLVALLCGLGPALNAARADLAVALHLSSGQVGARSRLWGGLVIGQVALSLVILICAGLFLRALQHATTIDPGFDSRQVYAAGINPALAGMSQDESRPLFPALLERVAALSATESAALVTRLPLSLGSRFFPNPITVQVPGLEPPPEQDGFPIEHGIVSHGYFETLRIPLLQGRAFELGDRVDAHNVAVVNESFARRFFPSGAALGSRLSLPARGGAGQNDADMTPAGRREVEIVGIVRDSKYRTLDEEPLPYLYLPFAQNPTNSAGLLVRHAGGTGGFPELLRFTLREHAPHLPIGNFGSLEDRLAVALLPQRIAGSVAGALGLIGLLLTALGLYGVVAWSVVRRAGEIGMRMSIGATPTDIVRLILRQGITLTLIGIAVGIPAAFGTSRLLSSFLVGVSPMDPVTYLGISAVLLVTALLASYLPARRAARIDPLTVLRSSG